MIESLDRRRFLRAEFTSGRAVVRPPWSIPETEFLDRCTRCGECIEQCETGILEAGDGGFPEVNFQRGECSFCRACIGRCAPGAIGQHIDSPWTLRAVLDSSTCLAARGVLCALCVDQCPTRAIRFLPQRAISIPRFDLSACTGCGACIAPCPVSALSLHALPTENIPCT
ncbi:MAG: ferredoxin-type protein NapF [Gammaproteobacteria bacterium]|nr:ferredoxin-type protein NapF [Gammaproteobacteria bacterium]